MYYTIGEMAKKLHVAPSKLRYYDKEGLLPFVERSKGGIRMFSEGDFEWLSIIECLKKTGMSIKDIRTFIGWCMEGDSTIEQRLELIERQRDAVILQMKQVQETLDTLNYKKWYYEIARDVGTCSVHDTLTMEEIPEEYRAIKERLDG